MITIEAFPLPQRILTTLDPAEHERLASFAKQQVDGAGHAATVLAPLWQRACTQIDRIRALQAAHAAVVGWRYDIANASGKHVHGHRVGRERFLIPIDDTTLNWDRLTPTTKDGMGTPGEATMRAVEAMAREQFRRHRNQDTIHHVVKIDGVPWGGTMLVQGDAARKVADDVTGRLAARGITDVDFGENPVFVRNPCDSSRARFFQRALEILATVPDVQHRCGRQQWYGALYLLLLSPKYKCGGDAIARTFAVATAEVILGGDIPPYPHDVDFRAFVLPWSEFQRDVAA